jgi:hypothetical protein
MEAGTAAKKAVPAKAGMSTAVKAGIAVAVVTVVAAAVVVPVVILSNKDPSPPSAPPPTPPPSPNSPVAAPGTTLPLIGHYMTNWGTAITVTADAWFSMSSYGTSESDIDSFGANYIIMQNPADDAYNPSKWSKVQWHGAGATGFSFCTTVYSAATKEAALLENTYATYDPTDAAAGCGASGFSHSVASPYTMPNSGTYLDNWGTYITINDETWYSGSGTGYSDIHVYGADMAVVQTSPSAYYPNTWSKIRFHTVGSGFGYCTTNYNEPNISSAFAAVGVYNASDATSGCGASGFGHSVASPYNMPVAGSYTDNYGSSLTVSNTKWGTSDIVAYTNAWVVYKTSPTATYSPNTYSKIRFHTVGSGFGYCTTAYGQATAIAALTATEVYDAADASSGCGSSGFAHTVISPVAGR